MKAAKAAVRHNRKIHSDGYWKAQEQAEREKKKAMAVKAWWRHRRTWKSVRIGNRVGKLCPGYGWRGWVEFPDGSQQWIEPKQGAPAP